MTCTCIVCLESWCDKLFWVYTKYFVNHPLGINICPISWLFIDIPLKTHSDHTRTNTVPQLSPEMWGHLCCFRLANQLSLTITLSQSGSFGSSLCCNDAGLSKNPKQPVVQLHPVMMQYHESASSMCNLRSCIISVKKIWIRTGLKGKEILDSHMVTQWVEG